MQASRGQSEKLVVSFQEWCTNVGALDRHLCQGDLIKSCNIHNSKIIKFKGDANLLASRQRCKSTTLAFS